MTKAQPYLDLQKKQQDELSNFPIAYAFNGKQIEEALAKLQATKAEVVTLGYGTLIKKTNVPAFKEMNRRHREELAEAMKDREFAEAAFLHEMDNHEYAINWDGDDEVLACFNMSETDLVEMDLVDAYRRARNAHMKHAEEWGVI